MKKIAATTLRLTIGLAILLSLGSIRSWAQQSTDTKPDSYLNNDREPDERFKVDILLVIAHPDDEVMVTSYLAREILDHKKRVAVVYGTRGESSVNEVGPEQSTAMGAIREMEGRRALASLGITNVWFLDGRDTASQNVLQSLAHWGHGSSLDRLVRIVRITRPSVIFTWLPVFVTGENHGDHQAAGVLATEAFDAAGDPTSFPEQVSPARDPRQNGNLTEGLRPWQAQKLYYFANPSQPDALAGYGPEFSSKDISPARHVSYGRLAAESLTSHMTQGGGDAKRALADNTVDTLEHPIGFMQPVRFILGKSLVKSAVKEDIFTGVVAGGIPFRPAAESNMPSLSPGSFELGDPWYFYKRFWQVHGLRALTSLVQPQISVMPGKELGIPLVIENPTDASIVVTVAVDAPAGWTIKPMPPSTVGPHAKYFLRVEAVSPPVIHPGMQRLSLSAKSSTGDLGVIALDVEIVAWAFSGIL